MQPIFCRGRSVRIARWLTFSWLAFSSLVFSLSGLSLLGGCSNSTIPTPPPKATNSPTPSSTGATARDLLKKMRNVYREAKSYTDNASVVFYAITRSTGGELETPFTRSSVAFERPNKFHITYKNNISSPQEESYEIVSNGVVVRSTADEVPEQVHEAIAPLELSAENFIPEPALRGALLQNPIEDTLPQITLLLTKESEQPIFPGEDQAKVLGESELGGKTYHRVELPSLAGKRVLWIDKDNFTLRRMEVPIDNEKQQINSRNQFSQISVWIDFEDVTLNPEIEPETFQLAVTGSARRVRRFISPPPPGPPEYLGRPVGQFVFQTLDGEAVTPQTLEGKVAVLEFWFTNCPPCRTQTPVLNEVYQHFKDSEEVAFLAVSTDNRAVSNEVVEQTLESWGGEMPIVRDLKKSGFHDLNVSQTPTLLLVDRESRLQVFQVGVHQKSGRVIETIQRLVDGEDLVAVDRDKHAEYVEQYENALDAAAIENSIVEVEIARPEVPPRRLPEKILLKQLWQTSTEQVQRPGDVLFVEDNQPESFRLHVLDEGRLDDGQAIVELDNAGQTIGRHELPQHKEQTGGFLRSWAGDKGQRWTLASGVGWQQVYVFDPEWEPILSFPDERHSGIGDVLFADLTGSGTPVMHVGYWGGLGVQGGTLDGRRLWSNRRLHHVVQIGIGPSADNQGVAGGNRTVWCTSTRGTLTQLGADGKWIQERYLTGQTLMYFVSQPNGRTHCGLSIGKVGQYTAVGFDQSDSPAWKYPLPRGEYVEQLPRVQSVQLPSGEGSEGEESKRAAWLIAAANGSLHWLNEGGELIDRFDYGEILTGVAWGSVGDQSLLFVSTAENLTAWQVTAPPKPSREKPAPPVSEAPAEEAE